MARSRREAFRAAPSRSGHLLRCVTWLKKQILRLPPPRSTPTTKTCRWGPRWRKRLGPRALRMTACLA